MSFLCAAFGKVRITPEEDVSLRGYPSRDFAVKVETGVLDDLFARLLLLESGEQKVLLVSVDCCCPNEAPGAELDGSPDFTFPHGTTRRWGAAAGIPDDGVSVYATHTHGAPSYFGEKYIDRVADEIRKLKERLVPVRVTHTTGNCSIAVNRRPGLKPNFNLQVDRSMDVIRFETETGRALGAIVRAAVHPTVLWNTADRVTADVVGKAVQDWEKQASDDGFVALFLQGFSGDVGPLAGGPLGGETGDTYYLVETLGKKLSYDIIECLPRLRPVEALPLATRKVTLDWPTKPGYPKPIQRVTLMAVRLGDIVLFSASLEVFNGHMAAIVRTSPFPITATIGVANGYEGYLPTKAAYADELGGYEMRVTPFTEEAVELFYRASADLLLQLWDDGKS